MRFCLLLLFSFLCSKAALGNDCGPNAAYNDVLGCAQGIHDLLYNRPAEDRPQALQSAFGGVEPGLRYHRISCPGSQIPVSGRSDFEPHQRDVYTLPVIRSGGGYHVLDFGLDANRCVQSRWTQYQNSGNATGPVSVPFREIVCRTGPSGSSGPEYLETQLSLPIQRYLSGPGASQGRYVQSSAITYSREASTRGVESSQAVNVSDDRVRNLLWLDLRYSMERLTASIMNSDSDGAREFWRNEANVKQMAQLIDRCDLAQNQESLSEGSDAANSFFNAYADLVGVYRMRLTRQGTSPTQTPAGQPGEGGGQGTN